MTQITWIETHQIHQDIRGGFNFVWFCTVLVFSMYIVGISITVVSAFLCYVIHIRNRSTFKVSEAKMAFDTKDAIAIGIAYGKINCQ